MRKPKQLMKQLKFNFWGSEHEVDYTCNKSIPAETISFTVYPKDEEIRIMIGTSKVFTFHRDKGHEITWDCSERSRIVDKLCKSIAEALIQTITEQNQL